MLAGNAAPSFAPLSLGGARFAKSRRRGGEVSIRLKRFGKRHNPYYWIVVAERMRAVKKKHIEKLGTYHPILNSYGMKEISINPDRIKYWIAIGARISPTVYRILEICGILPRKPFTTSLTNEDVKMKMEQVEVNRALAVGKLPPTKTWPFPKEKLSTEDTYEEDIANYLSKLDESTRDSPDNLVSTLQAAIGDNYNPDPSPVHFGELPEGSSWDARLRQERIGYRGRELDHVEEANRVRGAVPFDAPVPMAGPGGGVSPRALNIPNTGTRSASQSRQFCTLVRPCYQGSSRPPIPLALPRRSPLRSFHRGISLFARRLPFG